MITEIVHVPLLKEGLYQRYFPNKFPQIFRTAV